MHRREFREQLLAELLPPLEADGTSHMWEAFGRRFTDMSYAEADLLSSKDKTFIRDLFPSGPVHASLFSKQAQAVIGQVGQQTKGVERMLRRAGFEYAERIDPFDGGPHFVADTGRITLVRQSRRLIFRGVLDQPLSDSAAIVARDLDQPPYFHAVFASSSRVEEGAIDLPTKVVEQLALGGHDEVLALPLRSRRLQSVRPSLWH
jgi:arginine N-succinyltransferase